MIMAKKKSLQKLTEIENLKTVKAVKEFLNNYPEKLEEVREDLYRRLNDTYTNKLGKEELITVMLEVCDDLQEKEGTIRNVTYEYNHSLITGEIHNLVLKNKAFPTTQLIAEETGLSRQTVYNHLKGTFTKYNSLVKGKADYMANQALTTLYLIGIEERSTSALKAFIELSGATNKTTSTINNYIQINNLRLSNEDFNQLPPETLSEIEKLISKQIGQ